MRPRWHTVLRLCVCIAGQLSGTFCVMNLISWCSHLCVTHLFFCLISFCVCLPVIHVNIPKSEGIRLFLWDCFDLHNQQNIHKQHDNKKIILILSLKNRKLLVLITTRLNCSKKTSLQSCFFSAVCNQALTGVLQLHRATTPNYAFDVTYSNDSSLGSNHVHTYKILTNRVTNQTWKLWFTWPQSNKSAAYLALSGTLFCPKWLQHVVMLMC